MGFNDKAITEAKKYFGYFALVSNRTMDTFTALENYQLREKIEELFAVQKGRLDSARPRTWYPSRKQIGDHQYMPEKIRTAEKNLLKSCYVKCIAVLRTRAHGRR